MGIKTFFTGILVSAVIMSVIWQISEMGVIRNVTDNFIGKLFVCVFMVILAKAITVFLSGGK